MKKIIGFSAFISASILSVAFAFAIIPTAHAQTATTCPAGYTCTPIVSIVPNCPVGFTCAPTIPTTSNPIPVTGGGGVTTPVTSSSCYTWSNFLTIGSTGADVAALQQWLMTNGYSIPYISQGRATPGYFGVSTAAAVKKLQTAIGQPSTGFVGPLTIAYLNHNACGTPTPIQPVSGNGIIASLDPASPLASTIQISTSAQTNNVPLAVFDVKSQNGNATLQSLQLNLNVNNSNGQNGFGALLNTVSLKVGGQTYFGTPSVSVCPVGYTCTQTNGVTFSNLNVSLPANVFMPITVLATIAQDTNNSLDGSSATVSLPTGTIQAIDSNYNSIPVSTGTISGSTITFSSGVPSTGGVQVSNTSATLGNPTCSVATQACTQQATFTFNLTAGNQPIYVPKTQLSGAVPTGGSSMAATLVSFRDSDTTSDSSTYFYVAPGQTKTFTANYQFTSGYGIFAIGSIYYGTSPSNLTSNSITSGLQNLQVTVSFNGGSTQPSITGTSVVVASPGTSVVVYGNRLNSSVTNMVELCNSVSCGNYNGVVSPDGTSVTFTVPNIPSGSYDLTIIDLVALGGTGSTKAASITITSSTTQPSITVVSPNGGETWVRGTTQYITWTAPTGSLNQTGDIKQEFAVPACAEPGRPVRCMIAVRAPLTIASGVSLNSGSYAWNVGNSVSLAIPCSPFATSCPNQMTPIADGQYKIQICQTNVNSITQCDDSNNYFTITSGTPTPVCPTGYICTPPDQTTTCPAGYTCTNTTSNCPPSYTCYTQTPTTTPQPSITVVSPNGGEMWKQGDYKTISWQGNPQSNYYKIEIWGANTAVGDSNSPVPIGGDAWRIIESVSGTSYSWKVGSVDCGGPCTGPIAGSKYRIVVRGKTGASNSPSYTGFDWSDSPFTITSSTPTPVSQPPVISGGTFPTTLQVNQTGTWTVNASDPQNGSLSYSVNWGDQPTVLPGTGVMSSAVVQTSTFTHSYSSAGTYTVTFIVKNSAGLTAQTSATVQVGNVTPTTVCPAGYICTPPNQTTTCPAGFTCTATTSNCPSGYTCYTQTPIVTPPTPVCPAGYTCTPVGQTTTCPAGYTCTNVTSNCPPSFICSTQTPITTTTCSKDLKMCPDGSGVGRVPPSCQFAACPTSTSSTKPSITVVSPNGGENWQVGNTQIISWKYTGQSGLGVDVYLAHPMGGYCYIGTASADSGVYNFLLSNRCADNGYVKPPQSNLIVSGKYKVFVNLQSGDARVPLASDLSNNYFTIAPATPTPPTSLNISAMSCNVSVRDDNKNDIFTFTGLPTGGTAPYSYALRYYYGGALATTTVSVPGTYGAGMMYNLNVTDSYLQVTSKDGQNANVSCQQIATPTATSATTTPSTETPTSTSQSNGISASIFNAWNATWQYLSGK
jgi:hypothetical protein